MSTPKEISNFLDTLKAPLLMDGGDVNIVSYEQAVLKLKVSGACGACPYFAVTFNQGLEEKLKNKFPDIKEIKYQ